MRDGEERWTDREAWRKNDKKHTGIVKGEHDLFVGATQTENRGVDGGVGGGGGVGGC